ncbi:MAG: cbb3-type cytochrome c oxidase subunit II [Candidatus Obscuribacterales bacterium]|nr:cbb3-type cytochrome c oxidase subunit II [Candidatus Obscuribacterales bacterium]
MVLFFAGVFVTVLLPTIIFRPTSSGRENSYTATEDGDPARGRQIYVREGCVYCHSQFVRPQDRGLGPVSLAGDFVLETPNQLGTARTGPDLSNEGKRYPNGWQRAHLINPRLLKPGSIMPSFSYLKNRDIDDLVAYIQSLGNRRRTTDSYQPPQEYQRFLEKKDVDTSSSRVIQAGRGLYIQDCASCHGITGRGNGSASVTLLNKPANFTLGKYKNFTDLYWFFRITEGVPGAGMPAWGDTLSTTERWNLVAYLKTLGDPNLIEPPVEVIESLPAEMRHTHQQWDPPVPDQ